MGRKKATYNKSRYYIKNGHLYCSDEIYGEYEVTCTVEAFLALLKVEGYY